MNENLARFDRTFFGTRLNRRGIDESNLRDLKALFVTDMSERRRDMKRDIETVCSLSPDIALLDAASHA